MNRKSLILFLLSACGGEVASNAIPTTGLVGEYHFQANASDSSGNGNDAVPTGVSLTTGRSGVPNSAYYFNEDTDYIALPNSFVTGTAATFSFWFKSDGGFTGGISESSSSPFFVRQQTADPVDPKLLVLGVGTSTYVIDGEILTISGRTDITFRSAVEASVFGPIDTAWHQIAFSSDATGHKLYFDGVEQPFTLFFGGHGDSHNLFPFTAPEFVRLGGEDYLDGLFRPFALDDVHVYNRALSGSEVMELFNAGSPVPETGQSAPLLFLAASSLFFLRRVYFRSVHP